MRSSLLAFFIFHFSIFNLPAWAVGQPAVPTLARLSFWVPPQRMAEFERDYEAKIVPILKKHGLVESSERGRATPDSVFSKLFELKSPSEVEEKGKALDGDSTWTATLRSLGSAFGTSQPNGLIQNAFTLYTTPAGPGKVIPAGPGKTVPAGRGTGFWRTYDATDGLAVSNVRAILQDREGVLWFGTYGGGVSRYDGHGFTTFTIKDGLASNYLASVFQDREGHLWFGGTGGVSRYDGHGFTNFTPKDGLAGKFVSSITQDREGNLWFGTDGEGVSHYDGHSFTTFTTKDGLADSSVGPIFQDRERVLWFGAARGRGVSRYDGKTFTTFTAGDGLAAGFVQSILQDREGVLWFGSGGGLSRYDGHVFTSFTTKDGLAGNRVNSIFQDREGVLWFGTDGGVSRYDGRNFTNFTIRDGLASNFVGSIFQDREGVLWFGTYGGGVSRYDRQVFQTLTRQDGLAGNGVHSIFQDWDGHLWFGTQGGVTRYRKPAPSPPPVFIDAVVADRRYEKVSELAIPSSVKLTAFEFHGMSFKTRPEAMVYRYRLNGYDKDWQNTHARRVEYQDLPRGTYTFEVQVVDRDLVYSERPATVTLQVHPPYTLIGLWSALSVALVLVAWQTARVVRRDRRLAAANARLQELDALKTDFFSNVSHELRTPMTAIKGYVDNLLDGIAGGLNERQERYLGRVRANADRLTRLINDLLDLSRIDRGQTDLLQLNVERLPVREVVSEAVEGLRPVAEGAGLTLRVEGEDAFALADRDRLSQIMTNLVGNAIKFTSAGGRVSVTVGDRRQETGDRRGVEKSVGSMGSMGREAASHTSHTSHTGGGEERGFVVVCVRDTGRGIAAEDLDRIFDRFYQAKGDRGQQPGTGLGLSIARELVHLHGGQIWAESEVGEGSTFWFTLPEAKGV